MDIERAQKLSAGDSVNYPEDRGDKAGSGVIASISENVHHNIRGVAYLWVALVGGGVWPSNRLHQTRTPAEKREEVANANAHLIAAAPEMLDALERILRYQTNDPYIDDICQRAINKAKGL